MIYSVTINNKAIADSGLRVSLQTAYIVGGIVQMTTNWQDMTKLEHEGRVFFWLDYNKILSELPALELKADSLYRALKSICDEGFLIAHPESKALKKPFYAISEKSYLLFGSDIGKKSEYSEKNPSARKKIRSDIGKKSVLTSEKNPYNNSTKENSTEDNFEEEAVDAGAKKNKEEKKYADAQGEWVEQEAPTVDPWGWEEPKQPAQKKQIAEPLECVVGEKAKSPRAAAAYSALEQPLAQLRGILEDAAMGVSSPYRSDAMLYISGLLMNLQQGVNSLFTHSQAAQFDSHELFEGMGRFYAMKAQLINDGRTTMKSHKPMPQAFVSWMMDAAKLNYPIDFWLSRVRKAIQQNAEWATPLGLPDFWQKEHEIWAKANGKQPPQGGTTHAQPMTKSQQAHLTNQQIFTSQFQQDVEKRLRAKLKRGEHNEADFEDARDLYVRICEEENIAIPFTF